ncbi:mannitol dehydrogenase family protein [Amycolatopsis sp. YIM 10]|uniref:mannitol dehydrogenase family protein n=1 Tax=Amycolatopsis sp. YIM 10 TaxID=2653857 RepID=UPI00129005B1|nr:mannitol dehydrogenase family protein [Amycolatopsis sp. YIM 10]
MERIGDTMAVPRLSRRTLGERRPELLDSVQGEDIGAGILHLGIGAFHRAHQAVLTEQALLVEPGDWAIRGVSYRGPGAADALNPQDGLYTVVERGANERFRMVGAVRDVLYQRPDEVRAMLASSECRIVTITVTEAGYRHDPATNRLRRDDPELTADLAGRTPRTVIGQLVDGLRARRSRGEDAPITVLSCDNLLDNGKLVAGLARDFCALAGNPALADWIDGHVAFPSTVVDQIVPAPTGDCLREVEARLGLSDHAAVAGEAYRQWVIEEFDGPRPAWDRVGARFVPDIAAAQARKLRLVNGTHSAIAYLGLLAELETTAELVREEDFAEYIQALVRAETGPSLGNGDGEEAERIVRRLATPRIDHRLRQIAGQGARKLPQRLLEPARDLLAAGREPRLICLGIAGWISFLRGAKETGALDEDSRELAAAPDVDRLLGAWRGCPEDLRESKIFRDLIAEALDGLRSDGVRRTVRRAVAERN